jgi:creatinine amidohydrolase
MLLHNCTWAEAEQRMAKSPGIIIPIGSTEQHGPNGLIGTDAICADALAEAAGEKMDVLVAPGIPVGMAQHHMAFKGSMTVRASTLIQLIGDWVGSLAQHGLTHFYFINAHGGNIATIKSAFDEVYATAKLKGGNAGQIQCRSVNWWTGDRTTKLRQSLYGKKEGAHATPSEVSLTQFLRPDVIKNVAMAGDAGKVQSYKDADDFREKFPDGRMGSDPSIATPEDGKNILDACVEDIAEDYEKFLAGAA